MLTLNHLKIRPETCDYAIYHLKLFKKEKKMLNNKGPKIDLGSIPQMPTNDIPPVTEA